MPKISDILREGRSISFEFFPPKTEEAEAILERTLHELDRKSIRLGNFTHRQELSGQ